MSVIIQVQRPEIRANRMAAVNLTPTCDAGRRKACGTGGIQFFLVFRKDQHRFARQVQTFADGTIGGGFNLLTDACVEKALKQGGEIPRRRVA